MKQFSYRIQDPLGIHARPAGLLARAAKAHADTTITVHKDGHTAKASQLMKLMSLNVRQGDTITVTAEGGDEEAAIDSIQKFFEENL